MQNEICDYDSAPLSERYTPPDVDYPIASTLVVLPAVKQQGLISVAHCIRAVLPPS